MAEADSSLAMIFKYRLSGIPLLLSSSLMPSARRNSLSTLHNHLRHCQHCRDTELDKGPTCSWKLALWRRTESSCWWPSMKWRSATCTTSSSGRLPLRGGCTGASFTGGITGAPTRRQKGSARASRHSSHRNCSGIDLRSTPTQSQCCHTPHASSCA